MAKRMDLDIREIAASAKPHFLFRTGSRQSRGINTATVIDPLEGYDSQYHTDINSIELPTLRHMLLDHINFNYTSPSEFSSWSVSFLYVLVHAIRKAYSEDEDDAIVHVMDTKTLPDERVRSAAEMINRKNYDIEWAPNLREYAQGEYLNHGRLDYTPGLWSAVELKDLVMTGLWKVFPCLRDPSCQHYLYQRLMQLRLPYFNKVWKLDPEMLDKHVKVAKCFGVDWESIVTVALLTTRRRNLSDDGMEIIEAGLDSMKLPRLPWEEDIGLRSLHITLRHVPEAHQFMQLLRRLHDRERATEPEKHAKALRVEVREVVEQMVFGPEMDSR